MASYGQGRVKVGTERTLIAVVHSSKNHSWLIHNSGPSVVYLGGETVTADAETGGFPINPDQWLPLPALWMPVELYGITEKGASCISYLNPEGT